MFVPSSTSTTEVGRVVPITDTRYPTDTSIDLACLPGVLRRQSQRFPLLTPGNLFVGEDVSTYGHYAHGGGMASVTDGYFKGNVVGFRTDGPVTITLSYPVVEGLSGSPVTTAHNGRKAVGICFGSESQRVVASEVVDFQEGNREVRETVARIVEFGLAYRLEVIQSFLAEVEGVDPTVTSDRIDDPELA